MAKRCFIQHTSRSFSNGLFVFLTGIFSVANGMSVFSDIPANRKNNENFEENSRMKALRLILMVVGLDTMVYTIFIYLFTAVSAGGAVVVARYIGSKEEGNAVTFP